MAYSDFTLESAIAHLGITTELVTLFPKLDPIPTPDWLAKALSKNTPLALISEKSRSEFIVVPILLASRDLSHEKLAIYSGQRLDVDPKKGLMGECDFILALSPPILPLRSPIMTVVEAKKNDIEAGLGQCIAEMVAAQIFNQSASHSGFPVFGCITTGEIWQFLRLTESVISMDQRRFYLDDTGSILAAIQRMIAEAVSPAS